MAESYQPNKGMQVEAERAIKWKEEGRKGGTRIGLIRARQILRGENLSLDTVKRMYSFFSRHEVDKKAEGFEPDEDGYPSAGRVAWALWGGDAGYSWSKNIIEKIKREEQQKGMLMNTITRELSLNRDYYEEEEDNYEYEEKNDIWTVVVSTPEIDRYGTIIIPSGIDFSSYMSNPIVLAQHDSGRFPIGKCLGLYMNGENLEATMQIECITEEGKELNALINAGFVKAVSVGIIPKESEEQTINGETVKVFTKSELVEFSVVSVPANRGALIKRTFSDKLQQFIQRYKEENRMLTPEIEQKIMDELLPAVKEAVITELTNLGFTAEESQTAVDAMVSVGADALLTTLKGEQAVPDDQTVEQEPSEPPVDVTGEMAQAQFDDIETESIEASFEADEVRIGKKIAAKTEATIIEGLSMIKQGYRIINSATTRGNIDQVSTKKSAPKPIELKIERAIEKTTEELLKLI